MRASLAAPTAAAAASAFACVTFAAGVARANFIAIVPGDSFDKIEAAQPGDTVVIAPGTYKFRLHLTAKATDGNPITIRASDPTHPPVWDLSGTLVEDAPGSSTAGDRGRGCWQVDGGTGYVIQSIVFTGCRTSTNNSAGIRYYNGASVTIRDCLFKDNDNGLTGGTQDSTAVVEFSEFDHNGNTAATAPTHNLYIYGGTFTLRYSFVHDSAQTENFHVRAKTATLEANWFARAANYEGDHMSDDDFTGATGPFTQTMLVAGNVFVQAAMPQNTGQVLVVLNDTHVAGDTMSMSVVNNTFVGNGGTSAFVHLANADGTKMSAEVSNNIVFGTTKPTLVDNGTAGTITGTNNWLAMGASTGPLTASIVSASPGFANAASLDFTLASGSAAIGQASAAPMGLPTHEYFQNETVKRMYRARATAKDLGAFESTTTGPGLGPNGPPRSQDGGAPLPDSGVIGDDAGTAIADDGGANGASGDSGGCGCVIAGDRATDHHTNTANAESFAVIAALAALWKRRFGKTRQSRRADAT